MRVNTAANTFCITDVVGAYDISLSFRLVDGVWVGDIRVWRRSDNADVTMVVFGTRFGDGVSFSALNYARAVIYCLSQGGE